MIVWRSAVAAVVAVAGGRVEQAVVGVVKEERSHVNTADDEPTTRGLIDTAVCLQLTAVDSAVDAPEQIPSIRHYIQAQ